MPIARSLLVLPACLVPLAACGQPGGPPPKPDLRYASAEEIRFGCGGGGSTAMLEPVVGRLRALKETP